MKWKSLLLTVMASIILAASFAFVAFAADGWLITDGGAKVWLMGIKQGDTAKWTGGRDNESCAFGPGIMERYEQGKFSYAIEGTMKKGKFEGFVKSRTDDGVTYEGNYADNLRSGKGVMKWPDGRIYDGDWKNGNLDGKGFMKRANGITYEGDFVNGNQNGKGIFKMPDGTIHEGDFVNGIPEGKGILKTPDGKVYEGDFLKGERTGKGILRFPDGARYEGDFLNGQFQGNGIIYDPSGKILMQGKWQNDKLIGGAVVGIE